MHSLKRSHFNGYIAPSEVLRRPKAWLLRLFLNLLKKSWWVTHTSPRGLKPLNF